MDTKQVLSTEKQYMSPGVSQETQLAEVVFDVGKGSFLYDLDQNKYLDFSAGIFTQAVGHNHDFVVTKVKAQLDKLWNVHDGSTTARAEACLALIRNLPDHLQRIAFFTTGAEAVEAAIRAVYASAEPKRQKLAALRYGFHGKTQGARDLVHWDVGFSNQSGNSVLGYPANCYRCPLERTYPSCDMQCAKLVNKHISQKPNIAALFFEPIQGASGVIVPPKEYWEIVSQACIENGVLLVADEVVTAGGRTGHFTACEYYNIDADLLIGAKGLSSGFPFSMLCGRESLMAKGEFASAGATSSTYGGNPLSCAAASATIEVIEHEDLIAKIADKAQILSDGLHALKEADPSIGDVRGIGLLWAIEFVSCRKNKTPSPELAQQFFQRALKAGVRLCLGGNIIRIGPPLTISEDELSQGIETLHRCLGNGS